ncbi:MAG: YciI family protein [Vicinamibacteria bacterium]
MAQFMLLLHDRPGLFEGLSPQEIQAVVDEYRGWGQKLGETLAGGHKLKEEGGRQIVARGDEVLVTDGPFAEAKELMGGYFIIRAASYDGAVEIAKTCPHLRYGRMEIRQVDLVD